MTSPNTTFTELVSTTMRHRKRRVVDNVTDNNALLTVMKEKGHIKTDASGGTEIVMPISHAENATYQRYSGYDTLDIGASDVISAANYDWAQIALHVTASGRELRINNSKEKMIDLVDSRIDVAIATAANNLSVDMYGSGSLSNQINGLGNLVTTDGTGTVGGIVAGTYTFWKNQFLDRTSATENYALLKGDMNTLWLRCVRGMDSPDLIVASHDLYSQFESGVQDNQRYGDVKKAGVGFEALKYKSASVIFDDNTNFGTTAEKMFFLNTDYLYLCQHPDAEWTQDDEKVPTNQDAVVIPFYWMGQFCTSARFLQGVHFDS